MGDAETLPPLLPDVVAHDILIHLVVGPVLGVIPAGHDIGQRLHDGAQTLDTCSVRSHGSLLTLSKTGEPLPSAGSTHIVSI